HMLRRKPAAYVITLQICKQFLSEGLVFTRITDEDSIVLNRSIGDGSHNFQERVWYSSFVQEPLWNVSLGAINGINSNHRSSQMLYRFKSFRHTQVNVSEGSYSYDYFTEIGSPEVGLT